MDEIYAEEDTSIFSNASIGTLFERYGWYILIGVVVLIYLYEKFIKSLILRLKSRYDDAEYDAKYHKNPDLLSSRMIDQEKRTQLLQEKYNQDSERYKEKQEEKEQKKREELLQKVDGGRKLGSRNDSDNSSLRPEYNPLMGAGSSSNYRPPKKSKCGKGGCG